MGGMEAERQLKAYFNQSYKDLASKIDGSLILLSQKMQQFTTVKTELPNYVLFYPEMQEIYIKEKEKAENICTVNALIIDKVIITQCRELTMRQASRMKMRQSDYIMMNMLTYSRKYIFL